MFGKVKMTGLITLGVISLTLDVYGFQFNARITMTIIEKGTTTWRYRCDIVNVDGSRDAFDFNLNTETGEVSNL